MKTVHSKFYYLALWLVPTSIEVAVYITVSLITFFLSSQDFIKNILFATGDFNPIHSGIASIDSLLEHALGERVAGSLSLAIFWGVVGLAVNVIWWVASNFSTELNNDLVFSKYVHPKDTDPKSQLREFIEKTLIRTSVAVIAILYTNFVFSQWLPRISTRYGAMLSNWDLGTDWQRLLVTLISEIIMLHIFVVLTRLILLRKQIFDR